MVYQWKEGTRIGVSAQVAGTVCEAVERSGGLTAQRLVDASRSEDAPLHKAFEWNDEKAAEDWRIHQARNIIRSIEIVIPEKAEPARAFFNVEIQPREYVSMDIAFTNPDMRDAVLQTALRELKAFQKKYNGITELAGIMDEIRKAVKEAS